MEEPKKEFKVLGCGLSRTGTNSLQHAFEILYGGPCMHGYRWADDPIPVNYVVDNIANDKIIKEFFEQRGFIASTDAPFCNYYEKIMRIYPNAKFVLTIRNPETWVSSMELVCKLTGRDAVWKKFPYNLFPYYLSVFNRSHLIWYNYLETFKMFEELTNAVGDGNGVEYYEKWLNDVKAVIPKEKLLVFYVGDGWEPLCKFLGLPVPDVPFPNVNDRQSLKRRIDFIKLVSWFMLLGLFILPIVFATAIATFFEYF